MLGVFAGFEISLRRERQAEGTVAARRRGACRGRPRRSTWTESGIALPMCCLRPEPGAGLRRGEQAPRNEDRVASQVRLAVKPTPERGPRAVHSLLRQPPVPGHVPHGQIPDHDRVEAAGQHLAGFVEHRLSPVHHPQVKARNLPPGNLVAVAVLLLARQLALNDA